MHVLKHFVAHVIGGTFEPLVAVAAEPGVYCTRFGGVLHTCINRRGAGTPASAAAATTRLPGDTAHLALPCPAAGSALWDVWSGVKLQECTAVAGTASGTATVAVPMLPRSFGAVAVVSSADAATPAFADFLQARRQFARTPLDTLSYRTQPLQQTLVPSVPTAAPLDTANTTLVQGGGGMFNFVVHGVQVEGAGGLAGPDPRSQPDVQFPWEDEPSRAHAHAIDVPSFVIDTFPVTNARYAAFVHTTGYMPSRADTDQNYLRHWGRDRGRLQPSAGTEEQPVRWVSRADAEAFCAAEGKRLPHSWEWQLAAQGYDGRAYPWGGAFDAGALPPRNRNHTMGEPARVGTHPSGASASGIQDLVGVIWQMTDSFCDEHTCRTIVRGSGWCVCSPCPLPDPCTTTPAPLLLACSRPPPHTHARHALLLLLHHHRRRRRRRCHGHCRPLSPAVGGGAGGGGRLLVLVLAVGSFASRGPTRYDPVGSSWYFPAALRLDEQNTLLELSPSMDRSGGIGFRCAATAEDHGN